MSSPAQIIRWWLGRLVPGLLLAGVALVIGAAWEDWHSRVDFTGWRAAQLETLGAEHGQVLRGLDDIHARLKRIQAEIPVEQERIRQADKIIGELNHLASTWDRLVGNPEQQRANAEQLAHLTTLRRDAAARVTALQQESTRTTWEGDGLEITRASVEARLQVVEADRTAAGHYLGLAWHSLRAGIICALALYGVGCFLFFLRLRSS